MQNSWPESMVAPDLAAGEAHIWSVPLHTARDSWADKLPVLSPDERERAERFRVEDARRRFVVARAAMRTLLGQYTATSPHEIEFSYDANGKPHLAGAASAGDLHFNLAHSGDLALVAITRGCEVGVDVEQLRAVSHLEQIAERYFHPREVANLVQSTRDERNLAFLRLWTGKEAVLKAIGTGVTQALDFFVGNTDCDDGQWIDVPTGCDRRSARCWFQALSPATDYVGAVASLGAERRIRWFTLA